MSDYLDDKLRRELQREQSAATILAALIQAHVALNGDKTFGSNIPDSYAKEALRFSDLIRSAALESK